jgi:RNA polymerase sigma factor (sigma-70 family)
LGLLDQQRPDFLDDLDRDRDRAFRGFHDFAWRLLTVSAPSAFRGFSPDERQALISDVVLRCVEGDFRALRTYRGGSFAGWLLTVARRLALDEIRRRTRRREVPLPPERPQSDEPKGQIASADPLPDQQLEWSEHLECVRRCIARMSRKCQILLWAGAEGLLPREMQRLLGSGSGSNKAISDDLRYCRDRLKRILLQDGFDWSGMISSAGCGRTNA